MSEIKMNNGVEVGIYGGFGGDGAPIVFDLKTRNTSHRDVSTDAKSLYQNITVEDAKAIRKALKQAIKDSTGK
ncbi:hypothetical protein OV320_7817 [Actinobacteria bacterium OV320]|nr:hypothetical protein OV320_7817 [Actinobacteria bacterium OV320]